MNRLLLSFAALLAAGFVHADRSVTGRYDLRLSDDSLRVARLSGKEPHGWLTLHVGGRFLLETEKAVRHGDYTVDGDRIVLRSEDGQEYRGTVDDESVTLEGLVFERPSARRRGETVSPAAVKVDPVVLEAPAATPVVERPVSRPVFVETAPVAPAPKPAPVVPRFTAKDFEGVWTVWQDGVERKDQRMELRKDGTFHFGMKGATSDGTWSIERGMIVLYYTKADGQPLEDGASGRKEIPCARDASAFQIDTFRYERSSR